MTALRSSSGLVLLALLLLGGACASGPRGSERPPTEAPPPRLGAGDFELVGRDGGANLAAATTACALLGKGPIFFARAANLIPWRELHDVDERGLRAGFEKACGVDTIALPATYSVLVDVLAFARRGRDGGVSVEYSFDFLLVDAKHGTPWVKCVTRTVEGGKGEVETQALSFRDLDALAWQAAESIVDGLHSVRSRTVNIPPFSRERRPEAIVNVAFEDRLRVALLKRGITLAGEADYVTEIRVEPQGVAKETGAETYMFYVDLSRSDSSVPFRRWSQGVSRTGG